MIFSYKRKRRWLLWTLFGVLTLAAGCAAGIIMFNSLRADTRGGEAAEGSGGASSIVKQGVTADNIDEFRVSNAHENVSASAYSLISAVSYAKQVLAEVSGTVKADALRALISSDEPETSEAAAQTEQAQTEPKFGPDYIPYTGAIFEIPGVMTDTGISYDGKSHTHTELINSVIFDVYKAYLYAGILPSVTLAQGWLESGCFSSAGAVTCHNAFGMKWKGTADAPKAQDLNPPYPSKSDGTPVLVNQLRANAYFAYFNSYLEGFVMYGADPQNYYGYTNSSHYHTMRGAMLSGSWQECLSGAGKSDLMTWVGTGNTGYPVRITELLSSNKLYLFDDEAYMVAYLKKYGLYDGESPIVIQGHTFYPGAGNYTFCSRNHVSPDLSGIKTGDGARSGEGTISVAPMGAY